jgi:hypothetical protein
VNMVVLPWRATPLVELGKQERFKPAPQAVVTEERLKSYLQVCSRIKPFGDKIDQWEDEHPAESAGGKGRFKGGAAGLVGAYLQEFNAALQGQRMGPAEFAWIGDRTRQAAEGAPADPERLLYGKYRERLEASTLGAHAIRIARDFAR